MNENRCLVCAHNRFTELLKIPAFPIFFGAIPPDKKNKVKAYPLLIAACDNCSLVQQIDLLEERVLNEVYTEEYYNCPSPVVTGMGVSEIEKFHAFFRETAQAKGKLLEIACFDGYLLKKLHSDGWDVYGCDPANSVNIAIKNLGENRVKKKFFAENTFKPGSFDIVIFRNLLEHLYDAHSFLKSVSEVLKEGGNIFIDVPNLNWYMETGGFGSFFHQHISYFSLDTLSNLLAKNHFKIERSQEGTSLFVQAKKMNDNEISPNFSGNRLKGKIDKFVHENKKIKANINDLFKAPSITRIAIFGASGQLTTLVNILDQEEVKKIKYIFDNDSLKHGKNIYGCDIFISPPDTLNPNEFDRIIIGTFLFEKEIREQLGRLRVGSDKIVTFHEGPLDLF